MNPRQHPYLPQFRPLLLMFAMLSGLALLAGDYAQSLAVTTPTSEVWASSDMRAINSQPNNQCAPDWRILSNISMDSKLRDVAVLSTTDAWAVGTYQRWPSQPIIEHWNGTTWSIVSAPNLDGAGTLWSITAVAANDIWAVGYYDTGNHRWHTLTLHWNGTAWAKIPTPDIGSGSNYLFGVTAISPTDVWAVGSYCCINYQTQTLTLHWDGNAWQVVTSPSVARVSNALYAISAVSGNDVWAVGAFGAYDDRQTLIEHWDGTRWTTSGTSMPGTLLDVDTISSEKVWAVGYGGSNFSRQTLILRLTSTGWEVAPSPSPGDDDNILYDVAAIADNDIWAVGTFRNRYGYGSQEEYRQGGGGYGEDETLIIHWDGGRWTKIPSPNREFGSNHLYALDVVSPSEMWAVGESREDYNDFSYSLIARYSDKADFNDVREGDYFYRAVRYLYCVGVISGYGDNTFRPYVETTRAQLAKIVVLAHGWPIDTAGGPHFSDLDSDNPFYGYVETAYNRRIISGYADRTFRPGEEITRAQLCKIVVLARGWPINTSGGPHFTDVPTMDPFYALIETAYNRRIITGYEDRTFHPGSHATRGQISKIVYEAIISP